MVGILLVDLFITLATIFGYFISVFSYGAQITTGIEAVSSENFGSNLYQNCVNQYGANNPACQLVYNQTMHLYKDLWLLQNPMSIVYFLVVKYYQIDVRNTMLY